MGDLKNIKVQTERDSRDKRRTDHSVGESKKGASDIKGKMGLEKKEVLSSEVSLFGCWLSYWPSSATHWMLNRLVVKSHWGIKKKACFCFLLFVVNCHLFSIARPILPLV